MMKWSRGPKKLLQDCNWGAFDHASHATQLRSCNVLLFTCTQLFMTLYVCQFVQCTCIFDLCNAHTVHAHTLILFHCYSSEYQLAIWRLSGNGEEDTNLPCPSPQFSYVHLHGIFMYVAWGFLLPLGALLGRYYKWAWPCWFVLHIICQVGGS